MLCRLHTIEINLKPINALCKGHYKKLAYHNNLQTLSDLGEVLTGDLQVKSSMSHLNLSYSSLLSACCL